jgi:hypothetical protein
LALVVATASMGKKAKKQRLDSKKKAKQQKQPSDSITSIFKVPFPHDSNPLLRLTL